MYVCVLQRNAHYIYTPILAHVTLDGTRHYDYIAK